MRHVQDVLTGKCGLSRPSQADETENGQETERLLCPKVVAVKGKISRPRS